ncbi:hypothetical protein [uncultured Amphritea sp.]|uniref:hypothetical protein n=1 Tax=uncultured Amphritea sp. TaxID=981605 RepID=UPI00261D1724|nr:hypothetical protein [uncultured Amphritea sp.]
MEHPIKEHAQAIQEREYPAGGLNTLKEFVHVATIEKIATKEKVTIKVKGDFGAFRSLLEALIHLDEQIAWDVKKTDADYNDDAYTLALPGDQLLLVDRIRIIAAAMESDRQFSASVKDGMVDVWFSLKNEEFEDYIIVPEPISRAGSGTLSAFIDNIVEGLDRKGFQSIGYTQTW